MRTILLFILLSALLSCQPSSDTHQATGNNASAAQDSSDSHAQLNTQEPELEPVNPLPKERPPMNMYRDITSLIEAIGEYDKQNGTFKLISQKPLHIQVSTPTYNGDLEETIADQVKRDIVYVGFRVFAQTNIEEIKITSLPLKWDNPKIKDFDYIQELKQTVTLKRNRAKKILEKYYGHSDFTQLFGETVDGAYKPEVPNMQIKRMMYNDLGEPTLDKVFTQLQQTSHNLLPDS